MAENDELILQMLRDIQKSQGETRKENTANFRGVHQKIDQHTRDDNAGFTSIRSEISAVRSEVNGHVSSVRAEVSTARGEINALGQRVASLEGKDQGEEKAREEAVVGGFFGPNGTGRFNKLPSSPDLSQYSAAAAGMTPPFGTQVPQMVIPTPPVGVPVEVRIGMQEKHSSIPPVISWLARLFRRMFRSTAGKIGTGVGILMAGWLTRHVMDPIFEPAPKPVNAPATIVSASPPKPSPFPANEPPTLPAIPAAMSIDAGTVQTRDSGATSHR